MTPGGLSSWRTSFLVSPSCASLLRFSFETPLHFFFFVGLEDPVEDTQADRQPMNEPWSVSTNIFRGKAPDEPANRAIDRNADSMSQDSGSLHRSDHDLYGV
jgi:hypothetical protein